MGNTRRTLKITPVGSAKEIYKVFKEIKEKESKTYYQRLKEELNEQLSRTRE